MQNKLKWHQKDYHPMNRRKFIERKLFTLKVKGKTYLKCHFELRNNCILNSDFIKIFTVTKITIHGFYFRPGISETDDYLPTDVYCQFIDLEINPIKRHGK